MGKKKEPDSVVVEFDPETLAEIFAAVHSCSVEISGYSQVRRDGDHFKVYGKSVIPEQDCSIKKTDPDANLFGLFANKIYLSQDEVEISQLESLNMWWHSHVWSDVYISSQDRKTISILLAGLYKWWLVLVVNKHNQIFLVLAEKKNKRIIFRPCQVVLSRNISRADFMKMIEAGLGEARQIIQERVTSDLSRGSEGNQ